MLSTLQTLHFEAKIWSHTSNNVCQIHNQKYRRRERKSRLKEPFINLTHVAARALLRTKLSGGGFINKMQPFLSHHSFH